MLVSYSVSDIKDYINWLYFFHAWGFPVKYSGIANIHGCEACRRSWIESFSPSERPKAVEAVGLFKEANSKLSIMNNNCTIKCIIQLFDCYSEEDDIVLLLRQGNTFRLPMLRSLHPDKDGYCLSLADFIHEYRESTTDTIGLFATSVCDVPPPISASNSIRQQHKPHDKPAGYDHILLQTLADRLAEAAAEKLHESVRKDIWGYCPDESLSIREMHQEKFQGIRPAIGYPSLPDVSLNFLLDELLDYSQIGIRLTENAMMIPHASVSGLMISEPQAHYFDIGDMTEEQLSDYATRRGADKETIRKYFHSSLDTPLSTKEV